MTRRKFADARVLAAMDKLPERQAERELLRKWYRRNQNSYKTTLPKHAPIVLRRAA